MRKSLFQILMSLLITAIVPLVIFSTASADEAVNAGDPNLLALNHQGGKVIQGAPVLMNGVTPAGEQVATCCAVNASDAGIKDATAATAENRAAAKAQSGVDHE